MADNPAQPATVWSSPPGSSRRRIRRSPRGRPERPLSRSAPAKPRSPSRRSGEGRRLAGHRPPTAERRAADLVGEIEGDLVAAAALPDPDGRIAGAVATARAHLDAGAPPSHPRGPHPSGPGHARAGNTAIDAVLDAARDEAERLRRATSQLESVLVQARAQVSATEDFISARRGAVGRPRAPDGRARRRSRPGRAVARGRPGIRPPGRSARRRPLRPGSSLAQNDVGAFGGNRGGGGGDMMGAILGGIAVNAILGGGSRSRGVRRGRRRSRRTRGMRSRNGGGGGGGSRSGGSRALGRILGGIAFATRRGPLLTPRTPPTTAVTENS